LEGWIPDIVELQASRSLLFCVDMSADRPGVKAFEAEAELLAVHQLDLLSQLEAQLRAVQKTMRIIEKLRSAKHRVGPELEDEQRGSALQSLASELGAIDQELRVQHESCADMQELIRIMQARSTTLRAIATGARADPSQPHTKRQGSHDA
jgi:hypothetical protein